VTIYFQVAQRPIKRPHIGEGDHERAGNREVQLSMIRPRWVTKHSFLEFIPSGSEKEQSGSMAEFRQAKVRQVNTFFWDDPYIEDLCSNGKLLFLYLITTPLTNIAGSFEITLAKMTHHTGVERSEIENLLKRFETDGKFVYREKWMLAVNAIEHQNVDNSKIRQGIITIVGRSPRWVIDELCMTHPWLRANEDDSSHLNLNSNPNLNSNLNGAASPLPVAAIAAVVKDPVERRIWEDGVDLLVEKAKMKDESARPLLGRLARQYTPELLAEAIAVTLAKNPPEPKAFLIGVLKQRSNPNPAATVGKAREQTDEERAAEEADFRAQFTCVDCLDSGTVVVQSDDADAISGMKQVPCACGQPVRSLL
jgi:hypothetical protein